ncbi:MAG TPA: amidohydrolase family protein [Vicinamibacterales bacterium]|nr:amidohydrolase family protein [Vicinamibacterales bacterium]
MRIVDGRIAEVSRRPVKGERELDGTGKFLIPGLIDSHVHLIFQVPAMTLAQEAAFPALAAAARAQEPRSYLFFGFTTVIDLSSRPERMATWNSADVRPDALFCGAVPVANGFPMNVIPPDVRFRASKYFLFDPRQADRIPAFVNAAEHTPSAVVAQMAADGARCVKAHHEPGGPVSGPLPTPTADMFRGLVVAGRQHRLPVVIHANTKTGQRMALDAGADVITHTIADGVGPDGKLTPDVDSLLSQIASRRVGFQPTLRALYGALALIDPNYLKDPRASDAVPRDLLDWFTTEDGTRYRDATLSNSGGETAFRSRLVAREQAYAPVLTKLISGNTRFLFGSDSPATASYGNLPGLNGRLEMNHWLAAGVSLRKLLEALTIDNARAFGLDREIGTVEAGKRAHLLLLGANPLANVAAYDQIEQVIFAGRPIARATLSARSR